MCERARAVSGDVLENNTCTLKSSGSIGLPSPPPNPYPLEIVTSILLIGFG